MKQLLLQLVADFNVNFGAIPRASGGDLPFVCKNSSRRSCVYDFIDDRVSLRKSIDHYHLKTSPKYRALMLFPCPYPF